MKYKKKQSGAIKKPKAIINYNKYMSCIDQQDQMLSYYASERKTLRWYKKLIIYLFSMLILNSYFLYRRYTKNNIPYYNFRLAIISSLLAEKLDITTLKPARVDQDHTPEKLPKVDGKQQRKRCRVCYCKNIIKNSMYNCPGCPGNPALCLSASFVEFHT